MARSIFAWLAAAGLLALIALPRPGWAKLSSSEWTELQKSVQAAFQDGSPEAGWAELERLMPSIAADDDRRAVDLIHKLVKACAYNGGIYNAAKEALGSIDDERAVAEIVKGARKGSDWRLQILDLEVMVASGHPDIQATLLDLLGHRRDAVAITAIQLVGENPWNEGVDAVLDRMVALDGDKGVVWEYCRGVLSCVTGVDRSSGASYRVVWAQTKAGRRGPETGASADVRGTVTLFGAAITCTKVVFILDTSGSMQAVDPYPPGAARGTSTGRGNGGTEAMDEERRRITRAKKELIKVIQALPESTEFNVIAYATDVSPWRRNGVTRATESSKTSAVEFVEQFQADGVTCTDSALEEAYAENPSAYCFYLLSDGDPTHEGGEPPADTPYVIERIYKLVAEVKVRRDTPVVIHTLGFRGANVTFMRGLAEATGGTYRDIE